MSREQTLRYRSLREFILKQVMNQIGIEATYKKFCKVNGKNSMQYPEFDYWYYRFYNREHLDYDNNPKPQRTKFSDLPVDVVRKFVDRLETVDRQTCQNGTIMSCEQTLNYRSLREFILKQVMGRKSIKKAYKYFCEVNGDNAMKYPEFDYWYCRFYNRKHLDYDNNLKPQRTTFSDLPVDVVRKFLDRLEPVDRLALREVSHFVQNVNDGNVISCKVLSFQFLHNKCRVHLDEKHLMSFTPVEGGSRVTYNTGRNLIKEGSYLENATKQMLLILKLPKVKLEKLHIDFKYFEQKKTLSNNYMNFIKTELKSLKHQIHVEDVMFTMQRLQFVFSVLPYLKPGTLHSITLWSERSKITQSMLLELAELDQWKEAVKTFGMLLELTTFDQVFHFTHFNGHLKSISNKDFIKLRDFLPIALKMPRALKFYVFQIKKRYDKHQVQNIFDAPVEFNNRIMYKVPGTDKVVSIGADGIVFTCRF